MILTVYKIIKGTFKFDTSIVYRSQVHDYNTRNSQNIDLPLFRLSMGRKSFQYEAFEKFNGIPLYIRESNNYGAFKKNCKKKIGRT
jgi:hypothetical protein